MSFSNHLFHILKLVSSICKLKNTWAILLLSPSISKKVYKAMQPEQQEFILCYLYRVYLKHLSSSFPAIKHLIESLRTTNQNTIKCSSKSVRDVFKLAHQMLQDLRSKRGGKGCQKDISGSLFHGQTLKHPEKVSHKHSSQWAD